MLDGTQVHAYSVHNSMVAYVACTCNATRTAAKKKKSICNTNHWRRLVQNMGWTNQNIEGQNMVESDKCMVVSQLMGITCTGWLFYLPDAATENRGRGFEGP